jgi:uncharacterized damage-inducible protein DinB
MNISHWHAKRHRWFRLLAARILPADAATQPTSQQLRKNRTLLITRHAIFPSGVPMKRILWLSVFALSTSLAAQAPSSNAVASSSAVWSGTIDNIIKSAEQMPEAKYSFRPTPAVRSFGQLIGHVAGAQYTYCSAALGDKQAGEGDIEKTKTSKADLVAAIKASTEYCRRAYAQSDAVAMGMTKVFGEDNSRLYALIGNASHDAEHYGNIVTYLRMNGMVPPSSQPAPATK